MNTGTLHIRYTHVSKIMVMEASSFCELRAAFPGPTFNESTDDEDYRKCKVRKKEENRMKAQERTIEMK